MSVRRGGPCVLCGAQTVKPINRFCSRRCHGFARPKRTLAERFWEKVDRRGPGECWPWLAGCNERGYGKFNIDNVPALAPRVAWELTNGPIPDGQCALHECDNPPCCNPSHLFLGTRAVNNEDMRRKGRACVGEKHPSSHLTTEQVRWLRAEMARGRDYRALAAELRISPRTVHKIARRASWRHVA